MLEGYWRGNRGYQTGLNDPRATRSATIWRTHHSTITAYSTGMPQDRGLHSSTFQLDVSAFCGTSSVQGMMRGYL